MAQHDGVIDNASGQGVRLDINAALLATLTNNSGVAAPSPTYANQWWADTGTNRLWRRNNANSAWIDVCDLGAGLLAASGGVLSGLLEFNKSTDIAIAASINLAAATGNFVRLTAGTGPIGTLGTVQAGGLRIIHANAAATITASASIILPNSTDIVMAVGDTFVMVSEGSNIWRNILYQRADGSVLRPGYGGAFTAVTCAATMDFGATATENITLNGSTGPVTSFGTAPAGTRRFVKVTNTPTFNHSANLLLQNNGSNIVALAGDTFTAVSLGAGAWVIANYQRVNGSTLAGTTATKIDRQTFTVDGTWTKPSGYSSKAIAILEAWGGGASGSSFTGGGGGGGGGSYAMRIMPLSSLGATEPIDCGAGGAAVTSGSSGNNGLDTLIGTAGTHLIARGGTKGTANGGAGGNPARAAGASSYNRCMVGLGGVPGGTNDGSGDDGVGGVGGGGGSHTSGLEPATGGNADLGGGGGGGTDTDGIGTTTAAGGTSRYGGNGGAGGTNGTNGTAPGGGGGGARGGTSGAGATGWAIITCVDGA